MTQKTATNPSKSLKKWHKVLIGIIGTIVLLVLAFAWFISLIDKQSSTSGVEQTLPQDLPYLRSALNRTDASRGRILAIVTSASEMGDSGKSTGYELTELARAYYVFMANGFDVDIASPQGGLPPVVIDNDDMGQVDYAFLNDKQAQEKVTNSIKVQDINAQDYVAVYFVGGKGAMFDFPDNPYIQNIVREIYQSGGTVAAVCHGPAALVNVVLDNGEMLVNNRNISAFTNEEELFLIPDAKDVFPYLLEDKLTAQGANFIAGTQYLDQTSVDGRIVTGQNPWSVWSTAESIIKQLSYTPVYRPTTPEEYAVKALIAFDQEGFEVASTLILSGPTEIDRNLILMHAIVKAMKFDVVEMTQLLRLVTRIKAKQDALKSSQEALP